MAKYLLIESRDPFESNDVSYFYDLATQLARSSNAVTIFLVQNAVLAARAGGHTFWFAALKQAGVEILADGFSLSERGIGKGFLSPGVVAADLNIIVERLGEGHRALWH
jgi:hypothetical protein